MIESTLNATIPSTTRIKLLQSPTQPAWLTLALNNLDTILLDHSHCERKAAGVALNFLYRYPTHPRLIRELTAIAQEELEHFRLVNEWLERRQIELIPLKSAPYGGQLKALVHRQEPSKFLDSLLIAALIEARSHERLGLLAEHCPEPALGKFYRGLMASEARHYGTYWLLAHDFLTQIPLASAWPFWRLKKVKF